MKLRITRILLSAALFAAAMLIQTANEIITLIFYIAAYLIIGYDVIFNAVRNISSGQIFDENFLMLIATIGAFGIKEYPEACLLYTSSRVLNMPCASVSPYSG